MQTLDKETEALTKRIERAARAPNLQRLSQEECRGVATILEDQTVSGRSRLNAKPPVSLREQYGPKSAAWTEGQFPPIVRFWCDDDSCRGIPFHQVVAANYNPEVQTLVIYWSLGSILLTGTKAEAFFERFSEHKITLVKPDGSDILRLR
jgi:hypothetical protein